MIITHTLLNSIESSLAEPTPTGINYITSTYNDNRGGYELSASYNQIKALLDNNILPIIYIPDSNYYVFVFELYKDTENNEYGLVIGTTSNIVHYYADSATDNLAPSSSDLDE